MMGWHRIDDPELVPPRDGRLVPCMVDGVQMLLRWDAGAPELRQLWLDADGKAHKPTHWQDGRNQGKSP